MKIPKIQELFALSHTAAAPYLAKHRYGHEILSSLADIIRDIGKALGRDYEQIAPEVWVAKDACLSPLATVAGPTVIGKKTEVRPGAYIRGAALIGDGCVIGNSTEIKNAILFDGAQAPHYNYVGDSILGYLAHMGAGAICSNLRADRMAVTVKTDEEALDTGRRKLGALIGDRAEFGCGTVLCPGAVVGKDSAVYPLSLVRGCVPQDSILKNNGEIIARCK